MSQHSLELIFETNIKMSRLRVGEVVVSNVDVVAFVNMDSGGAGPSKVGGMGIILFCKCSLKLA